MNEMNITSAKYVADTLTGNIQASINTTIDGIQMSVPLDLRNRHYKEIMRQVKAGTLVIQPADEPEQQPVGE